MFDSLHVVFRFVSEEALAKTDGPESGWQAVTQYRDAQMLLAYVREVVADRDEELAMLWRPYR